MPDEPSSASNDQGGVPKPLHERVKNFVTSRFGLLILAVVALGAIGGAIGGWNAIANIVQPPVPPFSISEQEWKDEIVVSYAIQAPIPLAWQLETSDSGQARLIARDENMTFAVGGLDDVDPASLPRSWQSKHDTAKVRNTTVTELRADGGELVETPVPGFLFEFRANGTDRPTTLELVTAHFGQTVFARCSIADNAAKAYRTACLKLLDNVRLLPSAEEGPVLFFTTDIKESNIWQGEVAVFNESYDYLVANWDSYDPDLAHAVDEYPDAYMASEEVIANGLTLAGGPVSFSAMVDAVDRLVAAPDGRMRWVLQLISAPAGPGWRFYVQVNAPTDATFGVGDIAFVMNAVLVAAGATPLTDGNLDNTFYFLAQDVFTLPSFSE
jgi:hypothetical protein